MILYLSPFEDVSGPSQLSPENHCCFTDHNWRDMKSKFFSIECTFHYLIFRIHKMINNMIGLSISKKLQKSLESTQTDSSS